MDKPRYSTYPVMWRVRVGYPWNKHIGVVRKTVNGNYEAYYGHRLLRIYNRLDSAKAAIKRAFEKQEIAK